jgi:hypothetical protein
LDLIMIFSPEAIGFLGFHLGSQEKNYPKNPVNPVLIKPNIIESIPFTELLCGRGRS